jgi:hypothetical protein
VAQRFAVRDDPSGTGDAGILPESGSTVDLASNAAYRDAEAVCVQVDVSTYDRSCKTAADCIYIQTGTVCRGDCACGNALVNADGKAKYMNTLEPLALLHCACYSGPMVQCVQGQCAAAPP